jgi:hypothetical protein
MTFGCGGSLTNTREVGGGPPAGLAQHSGPTRVTTDTRAPALLAQTSSHDPTGGAR